MTPEDRLVGFAVGMRDAELAPAVRVHAAHLLVDAVSLARMAHAHPVVEAVAGLDPGGTGPAHGWARGVRLTAAQAALENGTAVHAHFHDDTDMSAWAHPASLVVPAVVAAAEHAGAGPVQALRGLVSGYAALSWLAAREEVSRLLVAGGQRAGPTLGAVAAAVGAATALGSDAAQTLAALGIAADSTGALLEPVRDGAQDWRLQNGFASQRGVVAALLGRAGVRGPTLPLTGARGLLAAVAPSAGIPDQWGEPPDPSAVLDVWFKAYPTLGDNMAVAVAGAALHARVGGPDGAGAGRVRSIEIEMNAHFAGYPGTSFRGPFERVEQAIASTAFAAATLLVRGSLAYADYPQLLQDPEVLRLVETVSITPRADFGYLDATVTVHTTDSSVRASSGDLPRTVFFRDAARMRQVLVSRDHDDLVEVMLGLHDAEADARLTLAALGQRPPA